MIQVINCKKKNYIQKLNIFLEKRRTRAKLDTKIVLKILKDIKINRYKALLKYEKRFSNNNQIKINTAQINKSINSLDQKTKKAIDFAYNRILKFHSKQKVKNILYKDSLGNKLEYKNVPIQSIGIYVPANLPSTLLMNAIPAKIAKVKKIVLANPKHNGKLNAAVLYAAKKLNIKEIYSMGGAQAIGSLAYIQKVDKIIGPGNIFVSMAKKQVFGDVGIEAMTAGPSEITIIADENTSIKEVETSLIGQAEHDINAQSILITKSLKLIKEIKKNISKSVNKLPRKKIIIESLRKNGLLIYANTDKQIIDSTNTISPEHIELNVSNYKKYVHKIINAGSICIGKYSPMAVTDYNSGTNHTLPVMGSAKFSSGLNINEFYKKISYITLSKKGIEVIGKKAITLAEYEGLYGHALSIKSRIKV